MKAINKEASLEKSQIPTLAILQITRFGDLIQTAQAIADLKQSHPNYRVILIARSQFAKPLNFLLKKHFDQIYSLDTKTLFQEKSTTGIKPALAGLNSFLTELGNENISALINLSFSKSSSYLASLIKAEHKIGPYFDLNNKLQINDKWSQMLYATVMRGVLNPFSLVDLFKNIIGIKSQDKNILATINPEKKSNIIVHPFASSERKSWKPEKWVEILYKTLKDIDKCQIIIVGAKNEMLKSQLIVENPLLKTFQHRISNLTGKTTLEELSNILSSSKLFIGHDSMVGHLAAYNQTTTLTISLGNVRPYETTPYQANAYNVAPKTKCFPCFPLDACAYTQCHHDIPYQLINNVVKQLFNHGELDAEWTKTANSSFHLSSVNLYRSRFQSNLLTLDNLIDGYLDSADIFRVFYRITWSFVLNDREDNFPFPKLSTTSHRDLLEALNGLQHLFELSEFGKKYSRYILEEISSNTPSINKIKEFSKKIDEIDHLQSLVLKTSPFLAPVVDYFIVRKGNLFGDNIVKLTESSFYTFEESSHLTSIMYELIQNTIAEHKLISNKQKTRNDITK